MTRRASARNKFFVQGDPRHVPSVTMHILSLSRGPCPGWGSPLPEPWGGADIRGVVRPALLQVARSLGAHGFTGLGVMSLGAGFGMGHPRSRECVHHLGVEGRVLPP